MNPLTIGVSVAILTLLLGVAGLFKQRQADRDDADDAQALAEWEMHTAIALDDDQ